MREKGRALARWRESLKRGRNDPQVWGDSEAGFGREHSARVSLNFRLERLKWPGEQPKVRELPLRGGFHGGAANQHLYYA